MKLSEAIRLGAMLRPQAHGKAFNHGGSCAFGAAIEATGIKYNVRRVYVDTEAEKRWPWLIEPMPMQCPSCGPRDNCAGLFVVHLNDDHEWTREQIADWIESIEPQEEKEVAPVAVVNVERLAQ